MPHDFTGTARGEAWNKQFEIRQEDGETPKNLTGQAIVFALRTGDLIHARLVDTGDSYRGSMQVTPEDGQIIVTVHREATAEIDVAATWALWLDPTESATSDAVVWGKFYVDEVASPDA